MKKNHFDRTGRLRRLPFLLALCLGAVGCASTPSSHQATPAASSLPAKNSQTPERVATKPPEPAAIVVTEVPPGNADSEFEPAEEAAVVVKEARRPATGSEDDADRYSDLWDRIRAGFHMPRMDHPFVQRHEQWFANNPEYMERMLQRANLYLFHIVEEVEKRGMPMEIALLPAIESAYQPRAYSHARASGLWQFIPSTGKLYGLESNWWYDGRRDVMASTRAALDYLEKLNKDFNGDWQLALAAYNCGEGRVARMIRYNKSKGKPVDYLSLRLPKETQHYVPKLMAMVNIVADPAKYGLELSEIPNSPYFVRVDAGSQIDLSVVAKLTNLPIDDLYAMNPAFNRWATAPDGPHHLLLPVSAKEAFEQALSELPEDERVQWARHHVKRGDSLGRIANRYHVSTSAIKTANKLRSNRIRVGQNLLIPVSGRKLLVAANSPEARNPAPARKAPANKVRVVHRVRAGETLWGIARRYNVLVRELAKWNYMGPGDVLKMGQKLKIWISPSRRSAVEDSHPELTAARQTG